MGSVLSLGIRVLHDHRTLGAESWELHAEFPSSPSSTPTPSTYIK